MLILPPIPGAPAVTSGLLRAVLGVGTSRMPKYTADMYDAKRGARSDASFQPFGKSCNVWGSNTSFLAGPVGPNWLNATIENTVSRDAGLIFPRMTLSARELSTQAR